jgi:hypothetical protein
MKQSLLTGFIILARVTMGWAEAAKHLSVAELRQVRLPEVVIESVKEVTPEAEKNPKAPVRIEVKGVIGEHIRFELLLPEAWNGRFVMGGGGGFVGTVQNAARGSVSKGYATVGTDTGHQSEPGYLAGWALDNLEAKVNFGYLAVHRTAEAAKALIRTYYGAEPAHFDLSKVPGLTGKQRKAIAAIYQGARNEKGAIYPGFAPPAECDPDQWIAWLTGPSPTLAKDHVPDLTFAFSTQIFKYLIFNDPDWNYAKYDFSNFERDTRLAASYLNATSPDLSAFKGKNGKLILWHGWADPALPAQGTIDYYRQVQARDEQAADYCRLFLVPGCLHCGGGPGAADVDWLSVIVDWVESGKAPDRLIASKKEGGKAVMTRPLYPYPDHAVFKGSGDTTSAESFQATR